jgi:hypothetical protein
MKIKIVPQNDELLLGSEVSGNELEMLKLDEEYRIGDLKYLIYDLKFSKDKTTFTMMKDDFEIVKGILKKIEKEVKEEDDDDGNQN